MFFCFTELLQASGIILTEFDPDRAAAHQAADERLHPLVADRTAEDSRPAGQRRLGHHPQRGDLKDAGQAVEGRVERQGPGALHHGGREVEAAPHEGVSGLQVPA